MIVFGKSSAIFPS